MIRTANKKYNNLKSIEFSIVVYSVNNFTLKEKTNC